MADLEPDSPARRLPSPCLVVLVGPSGSGKSTWAAEHFRPDQIVSSDALRAVVGEGPHDLAASADAFAVLEEIVARRVRRRLTTVVDTLGLEPERRRAWLSLARAQRLPCVAVGFDTPAAECRSRNRRRDVPVPAKVLTAQLQAWGVTRTELPGEGFDAVLTPEPVRVAPPSVAAGSRLTATQRERPVGLRFGLHIPAFTWSGGPSEIGPRLRAIAVAAEQAGFDSLWVLDHFRQIPLFGRPWEDMLESYTALAHLAAVTERVRLGAMVTGITYRNVAHLGKIVATLDVLSGGRAVCGLGLAWMEDEHRAYGWPFPSRAERYALLEDALQLLPLLWGPGTPSFQGRVLDVPEALCYPRPLQAKVPILVGGGGERRTLAARGPPRRRLQHHRRRAGRPPQARGAARPLRRRRPRPLQPSRSRSCRRRSSGATPPRSTRWSSGTARDGWAPSATPPTSTPARWPTRWAASGRWPTRAWTLPW